MRFKSSRSGRYNDSFGLVRPEAAIVDREPDCARDCTVGRYKIGQHYPVDELNTGADGAFSHYRAEHLAFQHKSVWHHAGIGIKYQFAVFISFKLDAPLD